MVAFVTSNLCLRRLCGAETAFVAKAIDSTSWHVAGMLLEGRTEITALRRVVYASTWVCYNSGLQRRRRQQNTTSNRAYFVARTHLFSLGIPNTIARKRRFILPLETLRSDNNEEIKAKIAVLCAQQ